MKTFLLAMLSVGLSVAAQGLLKFGMRSAAPDDGVTFDRVLLSALIHPYVIAGLSLYALGALVWLLVLAEWDLSKAYPFAGLGFVGTLLVGWFMGEGLGAWRLVGVLLICAGVLAVSRS